MNRFKGVALAAFVAVSFAACQSGEPGAMVDYSGLDSFGDVSKHASSEADVVTPMTLVSKTEDVAGKTVTVSGTVREVCQMMGCWLTLDTGGETSAVVRVNVPKDEDGKYVFTVPTDISGRIAYVTGYVEEAELDAETAAHYAEDAARAAGESEHAEGEHADDEHADETHSSEHAADGDDASPQREIRITASAISLVPMPEAPASI